MLPRQLRVRSAASAQRTEAKRKRPGRLTEAPRLSGGESRPRGCPEPGILESQNERKDLEFRSSLRCRHRLRCRSLGAARGARLKCGYFYLEFAETDKGACRLPLCSLPGEPGNGPDQQLQRSPPEFQ
ncbi:Hypothetical predicted protein [Marmota monax]|uniref:Uncharacterized protein n=1 Tax=Marmota monax TaxID=9995 RepID=A0A5E4AZV6_MARMO|nr:Hypothetical predicted protein [Marmota monax]